MAWLFKISGWMFAIALCAVFFLCVGSALYVRTAIHQGALSEATFTCVSDGDAEQLDSSKASRIEDHFFIWQVLSHYYGEDIPGPSMGWRGAFVQLGSRIAYNAEERNALTKRHFLSMPDCPNRSRSRP